MKVRIEPHARLRAAERGASEHEILETLRTGVAGQARNDRQARERTFPFGAERGGRFYPQKRVRVVYVVENEETVVVTVYVYYGRWED